MKPDWVSLERFNELRFPSDPMPVQKLQRLCRDECLPARKMGREWRINLAEFDNPKTPGNLLLRAAQDL